MKATPSILVFVFIACNLSAQTPSVKADPPLRWWKGNLHAHSLWSDGNDFPEMIAEWYLQRDYNFLALSDHNILSRGEKWVSRRLIRNRVGLGAYEKYLKRFGSHWVETRGDSNDDKSHEVRLKPLGEVRSLVEVRDQFILLQAEEITDKFKSHDVHMNATNIVNLIKPQGGKSVRDVMRNNLAQVRAQEKATGQLILQHLNHPNFGYSITAEDLAAVIDERFVEVYNGHPGTLIEGGKDHPGTERIWDIANTLRLAKSGVPPLFGLAVDDGHHYHGKSDRSYSRPGRGWIEVRCRHLTPESLIKALRAGEFYASSGIKLKDLAFDGRELRVEVDPTGRETYEIEFVGTPVDFDATVSEQPDLQGKPVTQGYSESVGVTLKRVSGVRAVYSLSGDELYVRAVITSSHPPQDPSFKGQRKQAWTQPVGWRQRVK